MMSLSNLVFLVMSGSGLNAFILGHKHLLSSLLSLEFIMLSIFGIMSMGVVGVSLEGYFVMFFLIMVACEGALGLSLLILVVYSHGNDYFGSFGSLSC
uniref:NADH-ubiquinone oxidoreductase chain 4L n=1 Tax=Engaewa walpolea TaxID=552823 RepID=A0A0X9ZUV2_9EUCA|nr:NADH dehydrogenase subunit 4L [Engaewa walpolea]AMA98219.1 NADH dehydrogenase subunit 4L [Engaewa walpolea]